MREFRNCLKTFNNKDIEVLFGPVTSIHNLVKKRIKDKALEFKNISFIIDRYVISKSKVATDTFTADGCFAVSALKHRSPFVVLQLG